MTRFAFIVIQDAFRCEDGADRISEAFLCRSEDCADAGYLTAVVLNCLDAALYGIAGCDGRRKNEYMLAADHRNGVVTEQQLASGGMFRCNDIDRIVRIDVGEPDAGQFACHACADDFGAVQAENRVNDRGVLELCGEQPCGFSCLGETMLCKGQVNVVIDMTVTGRKVSLLYTKLQ